MDASRNGENHYVWAVKEGLVEVWREDEAIKLRTSDNRPSEAFVCALAEEDALEIANLLYHLARRTEGD